MDRMAANDWACAFEVDNMHELRRSKWRLVHFTCLTLAKVYKVSLSDNMIVSVERIDV